MSNTFDRYDKLVRRNILSVETKKNPIFNDFNLGPNKTIYIQASNDKYSNLIEVLKSLGTNVSYPISITLVDEEKIDYETLGQKASIFNILNNLPIEKISLYLSDSNFALYNLIMNRINWKHERSTHVHLSLDRNPISSESKKEMHIEDTPGFLYIPDEKLIWFTNKSLMNSKNKIGPRTIDNAIELKRSVKSYYEWLTNSYDVKNMDEYCLTQVTYDWINRNIEFPMHYTYFDEDGMQRLKHDAPIHISEAYGTYKFREGVCEGQAKLMTSFLNNPYLKVDATTIYGYCPNARHAWVGINIDNLLFWCCTTMQGPFKALTKEYGYTFDSDEQYPKIYNHAHLTENDRAVVRKCVDTLKLKR